MSCDNGVSCSDNGVSCSDNGVSCSDRVCHVNVIVGCHVMIGCVM